MRRKRFTKENNPEPSKPRLVEKPKTPRFVAKFIPDAGIPSSQIPFGILPLPAAYYVVSCESRPDLINTAWSTLCIPHAFSDIEPEARLLPVPPEARIVIRGDKLYISSNEPVDFGPNLVTGLYILCLPKGTDVFFDDSHDHLVNHTVLRYDEGAEEFVPLADVGGYDTFSGSVFPEGTTFLRLLHETPVTLEISKLPPGVAYTYNPCETDPERQERDDWED